MDSLLRQDAPRIPAGPVSQIVSLCEEFERGWSSGTTAEFDPYLERVSDEMRVSLLRNLLQIELRRRRDVGDAPRQDEYLSRYDRYADVIRDEFQVHASTRLVSLVPDTETADANGRDELPLPAVSRLGDYLLEAELGRGAMGIVFAARHLRHGTRVALKTLPTVDGARLHRFKREFRALSNVNHPSLVGLHALQADGGQWFFTMDLVDGTDFLRYVRPDGKLDRARLRDALRQLILGVQALHAHGIVHRDIKPTNVMVTREGRVRLLDFGLVVEFGGTGEPGEIAGTPAYMAPEQFQGQTSPASDWYAVGVMLYQALSGKLPFKGSVQQLFQAKQTDDPPPLPGDVPEDLATLCGRLLCRDSQQRPSAVEIRRIVLPNEASAEHRLESTVDQRMLGRETQLALLEEALQTFEEREGAQTIFITGQSGEGKTVLAERFLQQFRRDPGTILLTGRCYDRESVPFKAIDTLIDALTAHLLTLEDDIVADLLNPNVAVLAQLFPVLTRVRPIAQLSPVDLSRIELEQIRRLAADALREILRRLCQRVRLVCFIDDLQWGDRDSAELLLNVLQSPESPHVLWIGTYRSDEAGASRFLQTWSAGLQVGTVEIPHTDCQVGPLTPEECQQLVIDVVGMDNDAVREHAADMAQETGGNPLLLAELASCYDPLTKGSQPRHIEDVVDRKLDLLPSDARELLEIVSVSGQALLLDEAARTGGHAAVPFATIARMSSERLLRLTGSESEPTVDTYHDRIRELVLRNMDPDNRKGLHLRLGEVIESTLPPEDERPVDGEAATNETPISPRVYDLAYHFLEADDERAFRYQLQAGDAALRAYAYDDALNYLVKAEEIQPASITQADAFALQFKLATVHSRTDTVSNSIPHYQKAQELASDQLQIADCLIGLANAHLKLGNALPALESLRESLSRLGEKQPVTVGGKLLGKLASDVCLLLRPVAGRDRTSATDIRTKRLIATASNLFWVSAAPNDGVAAMCAVSRNAVVQRNSPDLECRAMAYSTYAYYTALTGTHWLGRRQRKWAEAHLNELPGEWWQASVSQNLGACYFFEAEFERAQRYLNRSLSFFRETRDWMYSLTLHWLRHVHSAVGDANEIVEAARLEIESGEQTNDLITKAWGMYGLADGLSRKGEHPEAIRLAEESVGLLRDRGSAFTIGQQELGRALLQAGRYEEAVQVLAQNVKDFLRVLCIGELSLDTVPLLAEALAGPDWFGDPNRGSRSAKTGARRAARWSAAIGRMFPTLQPHCYRVRGRVAAAGGSKKKAARFFGQAIAAANRVGARYELARALVDRSALGLDGAKMDRSQGLELLENLGCMLPQAERRSCDS